MTTHLRADAPYKSKYTGVLLAKDFKTIADFKECVKNLGWTYSTAHYPIPWNEKSIQSIIEDFYNQKIEQQANEVFEAVKNDKTGWN